MLPLVPLHQMVPLPAPQTPEDPFQTSFSYRSQITTANKYGCLSSHRAFPIRASQPPYSSHLRGLDQRENYLRRKTPNGIIDAAYDGNHGHLASGPPPLKHMILSGPASLSSTPAAATNYEYAMSGQQPWPSRTPFTVDQAEPRRFNGLDMAFINYGPGWQQELQPGPRPAMALDCAPDPPSTAYYPYNNGLHVPTVIQPNHQQSPGPTIFNNGAQAPPQAWPEMNAHGLEATAYGIPSFQIPNRLTPYPQTPLAPPLGYASRHDQLRGSYHVPARRLESLTLESGGYNQRGPHLLGTPSPARFREKALANAHRAYVELLAFLHSNRRSASSRSSGSSRSSSKMVIYPRVPNQPKQAYVSSGRRHSLGFSSAIPQLDSSSSYQPDFHRDMSEVSMMSLGSNHLNPAYHNYYQETYRPQAYAIPRPVAAASPTHNARSAVDMLHHLCEQSDWRWVNGMLLGGCLYYGLERYEEALHWFARVLVIDNG